MQLCSFCAILLSCIAVALAYSTGAPNSPVICNSRLPHHGVPPQNGNSPYIITVNTTTPVYGELIAVTIVSKDNSPMRGFIIYAKEETNSGAKKTVGAFVRGDKIQTCFHDNDTATHADNNDKTSMTLVFKMPKTPVYNHFRFQATVVTNFQTFWTNIKSELLSAPDVGVSPSKDWTKTVMKTAKSISQGKQPWQQDIKERLSQGFNGMFTSKGQLKTKDIFKDLPFIHKNRPKDQKDSNRLYISRKNLNELSKNELTKELFQGDIQSAMALSGKLTRMGNTDQFKVPMH